LDVIYQPLCLKMQSPLVFRRSHSFGSRHQLTEFQTKKESIRE
jgi:hypothetical protein